MLQGLPTVDLDVLPSDVRAAFEAHVVALASHARQLDAERAAGAHLEVEMEDLAARNERLEHLVRELRRARFGRSSEKLDAGPADADL